MDASETIQNLSTELDEIEQQTSLADTTSIRRLGWIQANLEFLNEKKKDLAPGLRGSLAKLESRYWSVLDSAKVDKDPLEELRADWQNAKTWVQGVDQAILQYRKQVSKRDAWSGKDWTWAELELEGETLEQYCNEGFTSTFSQLEQSCDPEFWDPSTGEFCQYLWFYDNSVEPSQQADFSKLAEEDHGEFVCDPEHFKTTRFEVLQEMLNQLYSEVELYNSEYGLWEELLSHWESGDISTATDQLAQIKRFTEIRSEAAALITRYQEAVATCATLKQSAKDLAKGTGGKDRQQLLQETLELQKYASELPEPLQEMFNLQEEESLFRQQAKVTKPPSVESMPLKQDTPEEVPDLKESLKGTGIAGFAAGLLAKSTEKAVTKMMKDPKFQAAAKKAADARREQEAALDNMFGTRDPERVEKAAKEFSKDHKFRKMDAADFLNGLAKYSQENA